MKKLYGTVLILVAVLLVAVGCGHDDGYQERKKDNVSTLKVSGILQKNQSTPVDFDYSLERHNLTKRAYWVNGQRDKARMIPTPIADMPLGYVVLLTNNGGVVGRFVVEGKVSSLNSFLTPSTAREPNTSYDIEMPDIDGSYGANDTGIFFFTPDGKYIEWTGAYLYSDIPFEVSAPIITISRDVSGG
jgi:hypothetical protein